MKAQKYFRIFNIFFSRLDVTKSVTMSNGTNLWCMCSWTQLLPCCIVLMACVNEMLETGNRRRAPNRRVVYHRNTDVTVRPIVFQALLGLIAGIHIWAMISGDLLDEEQILSVMQIPSEVLRSDDGRAPSGAGSVLNAAQTAVTSFGTLAAASQASGIVALPAPAAAGGVAVASASQVLATALPVSWRGIRHVNNVMGCAALSHSVALPEDLKKLLGDHDSKVIDSNWNGLRSMLRTQFEDLIVLVWPLLQLFVLRQTIIVILTWGLIESVGFGRGMVALQSRILGIFLLLAMLWLYRLIPKGEMGLTTMMDHSSENHVDRLTVTWGVYSRPHLVLQLGKAVLCMSLLLVSSQFTADSNKSVFLMVLAFSLTVQVCLNDASSPRDYLQALSDERVLTELWQNNTSMEGFPSGESLFDDCVLRGFAKEFCAQLFVQCSSQSREEDSASATNYFRSLFISNTRTNPGLAGSLLQWTHVDDPSCQYASPTAKRLYKRVTDSKSTSGLRRTDVNKQASKDLFFYDAPLDAMLWWLLVASFSVVYNFYVRLCISDGKNQKHLQRLRYAAHLFWAFVIGTQITHLFQTRIVDSNSINYMSTIVLGCAILKSTLMLHFDDAPAARMHSNRDEAQIRHVMAFDVFQMLAHALLILQKHETEKENIVLYAAALVVFKESVAFLLNSTRMSGTNIFMGRDIIEEECWPRHLIITSCMVQHVQGLCFKMSLFSVPEAHKGLNFLSNMSIPLCICLGCIILQILQTALWSDSMGNICWLATKEMTAADQKSSKGRMSEIFVAIVQEPMSYITNGFQMNENAKRVIDMLSTTMIYGCIYTMHARSGDGLGGNAVDSWIFSDGHLRKYNALVFTQFESVMQNSLWLKIVAAHACWNALSFLSNKAMTSTHLIVKTWLEQRHASAEYPLGKKR